MWARCYLLVFLFLATVIQSRGQELIAAVLVAEAAGEGIVGMNLVLNVIDNRLAREGTSRLRIVTRPKQFSCLNNTTPAALIKKARKSPAWSDALRLASMKPELLPDYSQGAIYYHETRLKPKWSLTRRFVLVYRKHRFYA